MSVQGSVPAPTGRLVLQQVCGPPGRDEDGCVQIAIVWSAGAVVFTAAALTGSDLTDDLAGYIAGRAHTSLWAEGAREVEDLLGKGESWAAIEAYFAQVGQRWDPETLHLLTLAGR